MSSTVSPTPSDGLTPTTTSGFFSSATTTDLTGNFFKDSKPLQSYLYPTLSLIIAILVAVHACRLLERRRFRRRHALGLEGLGVNDEAGDEGLAVKLVRPRMYDVYLAGKDVKELHKDVDWKTMMPLSSNMFVHVEDAKPASTQQAAPSQRRSWLSEDSRLNFLVMVESIKSAVLHGLELVSLYNRRAERDLREMNDRNRAAVSASEIPDAPLDPTLPRELVTGVMILMPSRGKLESWEEDQLPDVAIGVKDKEWKGRIDVDGPSVVA